MASGLHVGAMLDTVSHVGAIAVPLLGALIAFLVYRLNAEKLFLEMLNARRAAVAEVLDAESARYAESNELPVQLGNAAAYNLPEQARFWRAVEAAQGLFGSEVASALTRLERASADRIGAVLILRSGGSDEAAGLQAVEKTLGDLMKARDAFVSSAQPYVQLGRRGLPASDRIRIWYRNRG